MLLFSNSLFTNKARRYKAIELLNRDYKLNNEMYQKYSGPYYSAGNLVSYGSFIVMYPMLIVYYFIMESKILDGACLLWFKSIYSLR